MSFASSYTFTNCSFDEIALVFRHSVNKDIYETIRNVEEKLRRVAEDSFQKSKFLLTSQNEELSLSIYWRNGKVFLDKRKNERKARKRNALNQRNGWRINLYGRTYLGIENYNLEENESFTSVYIVRNQMWSQTIRPYYKSAIGRSKVCRIKNMIMIVVKPEYISLNFTKFFMFLKFSA